MLFEKLSTLGLVLIFGILLNSPISQSFAFQESDFKDFHIEKINFKARSDEEITAEQGVLRVKENRSDPKSRYIPINFIRFKSTSPNPKSPIFYLAGGPGGSGISAAGDRNFSFFMSLGLVGDIILFDQRGVGEEGMTCPEVIQLPIDRDIKYREVLKIVSEKSSVKSQNTRFKTNA